MILFKRESLQKKEDLVIIYLLSSCYKPACMTKS